MNIKGSPRDGLTAATLGFFIGFAAVALFGPTANRFQEVMELSPMMVGFLVAAPALSGSLLRIPFSAWVDTTGGRKPFTVLLALSVVGMAGLTGVVWTLYPNNLTPSLYPLLFALALLCGCGIATFSVGISQVAYWHSRSEQGKALAIFAGVGNVGPGIFSLLIPLALASFGLVGSYLIWLILLVIGTGLYFALGRNSWYFQLLQAGQPPAAARAEAQELGVPVGFHATAQVAVGNTRFHKYIGVHMTSHPFEQMLSLVSIISNGVLDRFPRLKVGFLEAGVGFLPYWMERFDEKYLLRKSEMESLKMLPSEYIKDHRCYFTCEGEESALPLVIEQFGDECMMYASDYPHWDMEWPHSVSQVVRRKDISDKTKQKILADNAREFYRF